MPAPSVVVIEDDEGIGAFLTRTLTEQGYDVAWARTGGDGLDKVGADTALVVLDLGLPDRDGLEVCRQMRDAVPSPQILILTARSDEADVVLGLDAGADDYLVKPFRLAELLARVRACTRRIDDDRERIEVGDLSIDLQARLVRLEGDPIKLRPREFDLLVALARDAGRVVTRERLLGELWDEQELASTKTLDIHIWAVRQKIDRGTGPSRITTVRGSGYRLDLV